MLRTALIAAAAGAAAACAPGDITGCVFVRPINAVEAVKNLPVTGGASVVIRGAAVTLAPEIPIQWYAWDVVPFSPAAGGSVAFVLPEGSVVANLTIPDQVGSNYHAVLYTTRDGTYKAKLVPLPTVSLSGAANEAAVGVSNFVDAGDVTVAVDGGSITVKFEEVGVLVAPIADGLVRTTIRQNGKSRDYATSVQGSVSAAVLVTPITPAAGLGVQLEADVYVMPMSVGFPTPPPGPLDQATCEAFVTDIRYGCVLGALAEALTQAFPNASASPPVCTCVPQKLVCDARAECEVVISTQVRAVWDSVITACACGPVEAAGAATYTWWATTLLAVCALFHIL